MATVEKTPAIPADVLAEMQERATRAANGMADVEDARRASERMDRMRQELRDRIGDVDLAVGLIRDARNHE